MAKSKRYKQLVSAAALSAVVWSGTIGGLSAAFAAAASPFSDVKAGHWAEKHVTKLYMQGIIAGKGEGLFDPSGSIRREDAVIMALKFMGLADNVENTGTIAFPGSFQVENYAIKYVQEAFNRKFLLTDEEYALAGQEKGKSWGKEPASREWVARLLVRAIGKEAEAAANAGKPTAFEDDAKIDPKYKAYVLTAVQNGLVSGVTPTKFDPKAQINRASIATLFSKAEAKTTVAYSGQVSGVLLGIEADKLTVLHDDGAVRSYSLTSNTMTARFDSDKPAALADLKLYGKATLIHAFDGTIGYVEQTDDKAYITTVDATFSKVDKTEGRIWLSVGDGFEYKVYDKNLVPTVTDAQGKTISLTDIPAGANVSLKVDTIRTEGKVVAVSVKSSVVNKSGSGVVDAWDPATGALQVSDPTAGTKDNLTVSPQATFKLGDVYVPAGTMKAGDSISYEVKAGAVVSVTIAKPAQTSVSGKMVAVNKVDKTIQFTVNGKLSAEFMTDSPIVKIEGMTDAGLDDLQKDDAITMTLDANGKVTQIAVSGRTVQYLTGATIAGDYNAKAKTLSLLDSNGNTRVFILNGNIRYDLAGTRMESAQALTMLKDGKRITVAYSGANAITIYFIAKYTGTVVENNLTNKTLKVQIDAANTVTLPYYYPSIEIYGSTSAQLSDVKVGDQVSVLLTSNQDQIGSIQVQKSAQLEIVSVDAANSKIKLKKNGSATVEEWTVPSTAALQDENGASIALAQLVPGTVVNVTFMGKSAITKVKTVSVTFGKVASISTINGSIELKLPGGGTVTKNVGSQPLVLRSGATSSTLSSVQLEDRVEVRKDENDRTIIEVVTPLRKVFTYYNSASSTIEVQRAVVTENNVYSINAQTYIHQGDTALTPGQLKKDDQISIYILRDKVVEIVK